jgi:protein TonB
MEKNIIKNVLFSVALHGVVLACCLAVPAQKFLPLFCAGDSALTLTSLSIYQPGAAQPADSLTLPEQRRTPINRSPAKIEPEIEEPEENDSGDLPVEPRKIPAVKQLAKILKKEGENTKQRTEGEKPALFLNGDNQTKGVAGGLAGNAGVHPRYPLGARMRGEEGVVKVEALIGANGQVLNCAVIKSSGFSALDDAALDAVKQTRFLSANALPVKKESRTVLTFRFDLTN